MSRNIPLEEVVEWIVKNRKGAAFRDYPHNKIAEEIKCSIQHGIFCISFAKDGQLNGVVCGCKCDKNKMVLIHDILTTEQGVVKRFMKYFITLYPEFRLVGECRNRPRIFPDATKLERRLK